MKETPMQRYIVLSKDFRDSKQSKESIAHLYGFLDCLCLLQDKESLLTSSYVYSLLGYHKKAYTIFLPLADRNNRKDVNKLFAMEQLAQSHQDSFILKRKREKPDKSLYQLSVKDFQNEGIVTEWRSYKINKPVVVFDVVFEKEPITILIHNKLNFNYLYGLLIAYIQWMGDCRSILETGYQALMGEEVDKEWYEELEIFSVVITVNELGRISAVITAGDSIMPDHILEISFDDKKIAALNYDG